MPQGRNTTIGLSRDDIDALAAIAHFEARNQGRLGMQAVVDTVLNRVASPSYPNTIRGVVKEHRAFSALTGPARARPSITHGIADVDARLNALIDHTASNVRGIVNQHTAGRVNGVPSVIGRAVSYANPAHSDRVNREGWVNGIVERAALGAPDHIRIGDHVFGVDPWHDPAPDYNITPDPQAQQALAGIELPPGIPQARPHPARNPRARPSTMDVAPGFAAQAPKSAAFQFGPSNLGFGSPAQAAIGQMAGPQQQSGPMGLREVQANLAGLGFNPGPIDGIMGPQTAAGIRGFQQASGIGVDGKFGPQTQGALERALGSVPTPRERPGMGPAAAPASFEERTNYDTVPGFAATSDPALGFAGQLGSNRSSAPAMEVGGYVGSPTADPSVMGTQPFDAAQAVLGGKHGGLFDAAPAQPADFGRSLESQIAEKIGRRDHQATLDSSRAVAASARAANPGRASEMAAVDAQLSGYFDPTPVEQQGRPSVNSMNSSVAAGLGLAPEAWDRGSLISKADMRGRTAFSPAGAFGPASSFSTPAGRIDQAFDAAALSPAASLGFASELASRSQPVDQIGRASPGPSIAEFGMPDHSISASTFDPQSALDAVAASRIGQTFSDLGFAAPKADRLDMAPQMSPIDRINQAHSTPVPSTDISPAPAPASFDPFSATPTEMQSVMGQMPAPPTDLAFGVPTVGAMAPGLATVQAPEKPSPASFTPEKVMDAAIPAAAVQQSVAPQAAPQAQVQAPAQVAQPAQQAPAAMFDPQRSFAQPAPMQTQPATAAQFSPVMSGNLGFGSFEPTGIHGVDMGLTFRDQALASGMSSQEANYGAWDAFNSSPGAGYGPNVAQMSLAMAKANGMGRGQNDAAGLSRDQAESSGGMTGSGIGGGPASF